MNTTDIIPIHMKVVSNVNSKTDLILIFRQNLRFYKNDVIVDVKSNITKFSFTFNEIQTTYEPDTPFRKLKMDFIFIVHISNVFLVTKNWKTFILMINLKKFMTPVMPY